MEDVRWLHSGNKDEWVNVSRKGKKRRDASFRVESETENREGSDGNYQDKKKDSISIILSERTRERNT